MKSGNKCLIWQKICVTFENQCIFVVSEVVSHSDSEATWWCPLVHSPLGVDLLTHQLVAVPVEEEGAGQECAGW